MPVPPAIAHSTKAARIQPSSRPYPSTSSASQMPNTSVSRPPTSQRRRPRKVSWAPATRSPPSRSTEKTATEPIAANAPIRCRNSSQSYRLTAGQSTSGFGVLAELVAHHAADLAQAGALLERSAHRDEQVLAAAACGAQLLEPGSHRLLVAVGLERLEALELLALGLRVHTQDLHLVDRVGHVLVHPDDDVLLLLVALLVAPGGLLDLGPDERDALDRAAQLVDLVD